VGESLEYSATCPRSRRISIELTITSQAGWLLLGAPVLSAVYELRRAVARTGVMKYDSIQAWLLSMTVVVVEVVVAALLLAGWQWAPHLGFILAVGLLLISVLYYGPKVLLERRPALLDRFEGSCLHCPGRDRRPAPRLPASGCDAPALT
jgi:hypothetical protein